MALDLENKNQAYLCGRLFAILEKIQSDAIPGANSTIKERYYGAASTTPTTVFGRLLSLSRHHLAKFDTGKSVYYEKNNYTRTRGSGILYAGMRFSGQDPGRYH